MISCHPFSGPIVHSMTYLGIFSFRMRFMDLHRGHMFDDRWFHVTWFLTYRTFNTILGHIFVPDEIFISSRSCMPIPTYELYAETMMCSLFYHDPSVKPLWIFLARPTFFIDVWVWLDYRDCAFDDGWFHVTQFLTYRTSSAILGHIFRFGRDL